jgi:hypothetical protein
MPSSWMLSRVALVRRDFSELGTSSMITILVFLCSVLRLLVTAKVVLLSCLPDDGGDTFLRKVDSYKSRTA